MALPPPQWADASERSNRSRLDVPSTYLLRLTATACADLGIDPPSANTALSAQHELVRKFADTYKDPTAIDEAGKPFAQMPGKGVYRIRRQEWRGLVWADRDAGVVWLCGAACLADFSNEDQLYDYLARRGETIFPAAEEREDAHKAQVGAHALGALRSAMQTAHEVPESWQEARMRGAGQRPGEGTVIGRAYIERVEDEYGVLVERFLVTVSKPPGSFSQSDWLALAMRTFPPQDGLPRFIGAEDLPEGLNFTQGPEVAMVQQPA